MSSISPATPVSPVATTTDAFAPRQGGTPTNPGSVLDRDAFLKLLVAQLKYQDPTNPTDPASMMAQTSQLTMVERLDDIKEALTASAETDRLTLAGTMVGRRISFQGESGPTTGVVDSVRFVDGQFVLSSGGFAVPMGAVLEVGAPPAAVAPAPYAPAPAGATAGGPPSDTSVTTTDPVTGEGLRRAAW